MSHPNGGAHPNTFDEYDAGDDALASPQSYDGLDETFEDGFEDGFDAADAAGDGFEEGEAAFEADGYDDAYEDAADAGEDGFDALDAYDDGSAFDGNALDSMDLGEDLAEGPAAPATANTALSLFEAEVADALDADGTDEFLGSLLGGFSRVASGLARRMGPAAGMASRLSGHAGAASRLAGGASRLAGVGSMLAQRLGHPGAAAHLQRFGQIAGGAGRVAGGLGSALGGFGGLPRHLNSAAGIAGRAAAHSSPISELLAQIGQLSAEGADEFEAFDSMADLYEEGVDAALPAAVGIAARLAARALGGRALSQLPPASRRAFVHGIATAARHLVQSGGPTAVRALPRLAAAGARAARQRRTPPRQVPQQVARTVNRAARGAARNPRAIRRLAQPLSAGAGTGGRVGRSAGIGRGTPSISRGSARRYVLNGPVELTIRPL